VSGRRAGWFLSGDSDHGFVRGDRAELLAAALRSRAVLYRWFIWFLTAALIACARAQAQEGLPPPIARAAQ
jgi:hypothetical protein